RRAARRSGRADGDPARRGGRRHPDRAAAAADALPSAGPGLQPSAAARSGVGARLPRGLAPGRQLRPTAARQDRSRAGEPCVRPDRARLRLPLRTGMTPLFRGLRARLVVAFALVTMLGAGAASWASAESASEAMVE